VTARIEVWLSKKAVTRCSARLVVSLTPEPAADIHPDAPSPLARLSLPAVSQYVTLVTPASYVGRAQLSAVLIISDDSRGTEVRPGAVLAQDARAVYLLRCSPGGGVLPDTSSASSSNINSSSKSCCLSHGFVPKLDAAGLRGIDTDSKSRRGGENPGIGAQTLVGTPPVAHFVFDVKGPPPRCSYFFFVAVRAAERVLRTARGWGRQGKVVVHYHFEPWGPWWAAIKALPHVRTCYVEIPREIFGQPVDFFAHHSGLTLVGFQDTHVCVLGLVCYGLTKTKTNLNSCTKSLI
jgi:hypothetical protein